jgi:hypothetical protein
MLGLMFLIPVLVLGIPSFFHGTFAGGIMGFCSFSILFGLAMFFIPDPKQAP